MLLPRYKAEQSSCDRAGVALKAKILAVHFRKSLPHAINRTSGLSWLDLHPMNQKVAGSIPSQGMYPG